MHLALHNEKSTTSDDVKKRKDFEANGSLHEHDMRTTKLPRTSLTNPFWENGRILHPSQRIAPCSSVKPVATNISEADRLPDSKERHINGITEAHHLADLRAPVSLSNGNSDKVTSRPPHPDSKYLSQVYSVPAMQEWPEYDDQEWLFSGDRSQQKRTRLEVAESPQVWAEALPIKSTDIIALPYVVPL